MNIAENFPYRRLMPLFTVQFLSLFSFSVLRDAILVLIVFSQINLWGIKNGVLINLVMAAAIVPMVLVSSYAGKLADAADKVWLMRRFQILQLVFALLAGAALYFDWDGVLIFALFAFGVLAACIGPAKYAMLPQYFSERNLGLAIGYVEFGTFLAILIGQSFGSWAIASHWQNAVIVVMACSALLGILFSFKLFPAPATTPVRPRFYVNPLQDAKEMYFKVTRYPRQIRVNLHAIAWFWALGLITSTEFSVFTKYFLGGDGHLFSVILGLFSLGLGIGTWLCAKISRGQINHRYVPQGGIIASKMKMVVLILHHQQVAGGGISLAQFLVQPLGVITLLLIVCYSISCGFYSLTCYTEIQVKSNPEFRAQVIASVNILSGLYLLAAAGACALLQLFFSSWWVIFIALCLNVVMVVRYHWKIKAMARQLK